MRIKQISFIHLYRIVSTSVSLSFRFAFIQDLHVPAKDNHPSTTPAENSGGLHGYNELLLQARESDNPEQAEIHNFLMLDIERRVYDLSRINDRLQAIN